MCHGTNIKLTEFAPEGALPTAVPSCTTVRLYSVVRVMYGVRAVLLYECDVQNTRAGSCTCCTTAVRCCTTLYAAVRTVCAVRAVRLALYGTVRPGSQASWNFQSASTASQRSHHAGWHPSETAAHPSKGTLPFRNLPCVRASWRLLEGALPVCVP